MAPFFSIVVPMYNCEKYIEECVLSVCRQEFCDYEVIVINDGSTDNSATIVEQLSMNDKRIKLFCQKNAGVASARNMGISKSNGSYIIFLDGDDLLAENSLEEIFHHLTGKETDMSICSCYVEFANGTHRTNKMFSAEVIKKEKTTAEIKRLCQNLSSMCIAVYRRLFLLENKLYVREGVTCGEDTEFYFSALLRSKTIQLIDCSLFVYRFNQVSVSNNLSYKNIFDVMDICSKQINGLIECPSNEIDNEKAKDFFATKYIQFAVKIGALIGDEKKECLKVINRDKTLLRFAKNKAGRVFSVMVFCFGARFTTRFFYTAVELRNWIKKIGG